MFRRAKEQRMAKKFDLDAITLDEGGHDSPDKGMCLLEAVAWIRHQEDPSVPFDDAPACVSPVLRAFGISWNDGLDDIKRQELKRYIPLLPGTAGDDELDNQRAWMATDWLVRTYTPKFLRLAGLTEQAEQLENLAELNPETIPTIQPTLNAIRKDAAAAGDAARAAARDAARAAARDAARAAAGAAAGDAAGDAAGAAAGDAAWAAARAAARGKTTWSDRYDAARKVFDPIMREKLAPIREELETSAHRLFTAMIRVGETVDA